MSRKRSPVPRTVDELVQNWDHFIGARVYATSRGRVTDEDAKDYKQAVYARIEAKGALGRFDPAKGEFSTYLNAIIRSVVCNEFDKNTRTATNGAAPLAATPTEGVVLDLLKDSGVEDRQWAEARSKASSEVIDRLDGYVATMKDGARLGAVLHLMHEGYTPGEIAERLGFSRSLIASHRRQLATILHGWGIFSSSDVK